MAWDKDKPAGSEALSDSDDLIRANNAAIETAIDQDHDFTTGGTQTGKHNQVSLIEAADIGTGAEGLPILGAQTASGKAELTFTDEDDNDIQITSGGSILSASLDSKDEDDMASDSDSHTATQQSVKAYVDSGTVTMTNKTLTSPTLTSPTVNTAISGTAVLDEDDMASDSATQIATQQSIKAYVDNSKPGSDTSVSSTTQTASTKDTYVTIETLNYTGTSGNKLLITCSAQVISPSNVKAVNFRVKQDTTVLYNAPIRQQDGNERDSVSFSYLLTLSDSNAHDYTFEFTNTTDNTSVSTDGTHSLIVVELK